MSATAERTALKEWAVLTEAMARGEILALVRKGGIRERRAGFQVRHDRFLLYPTFFHERADELAPRFHHRLSAGAALQAAEPRTIRITHVCEVAASWTVRDLARVHAAAEEYGLSLDAVAARFRYRDRPEVSVIAAITKRLREPVELPEIRRYQGCVSWVELDRDIDVSEATAALSDADLQRRLNRLVELLGEPEAPVIS
jgi:hypothetical protein